MHHSVCQLHAGALARWQARAAKATTAGGDSDGEDAEEGSGKLRAGSPKPAGWRLLATPAVLSALLLRQTSQPAMPASRWKT
jgi:hypothetical protein